jgi:hypothetical protein
MKLSRPAGTPTFRNAREERTYANDMVALDLLRRGELLVNLVTGEVTGSALRSVRTDHSGYLRLNVAPPALGSICGVPPAARPLYRLRAHRVAAIAASGYVTVGGNVADVMHLDGDPTNNAPSNLRYGSRSDNVRHDISCGRWRPKGADTWNRAVLRRLEDGRRGIVRGVRQRRPGRWTVTSGRTWHGEFEDPAIAVGVAVYHWEEDFKEPFGWQADGWRGDLCGDHIRPTPPTWV